MRILLADDNRRLRQCLRSLLELEGFTVVGEAANGHEAVELAHSLQPDLVVLDLAMLLLNGVSAAGKIHGNCPRIQMIMLSMYNEDSYVRAALRGGARGYVLKTETVDDLVTAIREVARGNTYLSPSIPEGVIPSDLPVDDPFPES